MDGLGSAQRILENQFMHSFHTGNFIVDTLIKGIIITATTAAFFYLKTIVSNWHQYVDKLLSFVGMKMNKIIINWKVTKTETKEVNPSKRFEAILHQVMKLQYEEAGVCTFLENPNPESVSFMVAQNAPFTFCPGVFGTIRTDQTEKQGQAYGKEVLVPETFVAEIYSRTKTLKDLQGMLNNWVEEYEKFEKETGENEVQFFGRVTREGQFNFSERLFAILHQLEKKGTANPDLKVLKEFAIEEVKRYCGEQDGQVSRRAEKLIPEVIEIDNDVFCKVTCASWQSKEGKMQDEVEVVVKIYSKTIKVPELVDLIKLWEEEYEEHNQFHKGLIYFVFNPPEKDRFERGPKKYYTEFPFESGKTFENIFFPEKEQLMEKIQFFRDNESWYMKRGIPHMLGLLLHGEPGCGKTSVIKAIANMTQRHIISVPLKNVKTTADLYHALYGGKIDKRTIPMNKRLYVLEDIDCGGLEEVVNRRIENNEWFDEEKEKEQTLSDLHEAKRKEKEKEKNKKDLTLSDLLEAFDGVLEMKGRMMVITTNHLEKLDPALIRPGRIDTSIEFKRCSRNIIIELVENFFDNDTIPDDFNASNIKDAVWTPAEVVQICINYRTNLRLALEKICERKKIPKQKTEKEEYGFYS